MPAAASAHGAMSRAAYYADFVTRPVLALALIVLGGASAVQAKPRPPRSATLPVFIEGCCTVWIAAPRTRRR